MDGIASPEFDAPSKCTPARLIFAGKVACIYLNTAQDTAAVFVSETLSRLVHGFEVTLNATVCGKKQNIRNTMDAKFLSVRIIVYGLIRQKDAVAETLAGGGLFLQHPGETEFNQDVEYFNPQYLLEPGQEFPRIEELSVSACCEPHR